MKKCNAPQRVRIRAGYLLKRWQQGLIRPRRTYRHGYLSICVTPTWRLLSKDGGLNWTLLSHADYDKVLKQA